MEVYIRHISEMQCRPFEEIEYGQLPHLINFIKESGGFYWDDCLQPFHSYQLVLNPSTAHCEILIGED